MLSHAARLRIRAVKGCTVDELCPAPSDTAYISADLIADTSRELGIGISETVRGNMAVRNLINTIAYVARHEMDRARCQRELDAGREDLQRLETNRRKYKISRA